MRFCLLALLFALAACASPDTPPADAPTDAEPTALRVVIDSLTAADADRQYRVGNAYPQIVRSDVPAVARVNRAIRDSLAAFAASIKPRPTDFTGDLEMDRLF